MIGRIGTQTDRRSRAGERGRRARSAWGWSVWGVVAFLSVGVAGYALVLVASGFRLLFLQSDFPTPLGLQVHIAASAVALLVGPFQFLHGFRRRFAHIHRWMGWTYASACTVGGASGGVIALYSQAGLVAGFGFLSLAILWLITTGAAILAATRRDFVAHERWMVRSFALTFAAVTLRLYLPIGLSLSGGVFDPPYIVIAWLCWVPNLVTAEMLLRTGRLGSPPHQPLKSEI